MRSPLLTLALFIAASLGAHAQFDIEESHTTASLRGIHSLGGGVAWASGSDGTVLRTEDGGYLWQTCAIPPGAEKLDFRGIQAFDEKTAIVMSSGLGDLSRLYKTTDGCQSWRLVFTNPDSDGFWDMLKIIDAQRLLVLGDPAHAGPHKGHLNPGEGGGLMFRIRATSDRGETWIPIRGDSVHGLPGSDLWPLAGESLFAASNSSVAVCSGRIFIGTSSGRIMTVAVPQAISSAGCSQPDAFSMQCAIQWSTWNSAQTPLNHDSSTSGIFSLQAGRPGTLVAVGGDYQRPIFSVDTAAFSQDAGHTWHPAKTPPHGYRSSVAYDPATRIWITTGPNGTDTSRDDGRNWTSLKPSLQDPPDADRNWNALSLPFVVGPHGRIGKLRPLTSKP